VYSGICFFGGMDMLGSVCDQEISQAAQTSGGTSAVVHVCIPFHTKYPFLFRLWLMQTKDWEHAGLEYAAFYLRYIRDIFHEDGIDSKCIMRENRHISHTYLIGETSVTMDSCRLFHFNTGMGFLDLRIPVSCSSPDMLEDTVARFRICDQPMEDGKSLCDLAEEILAPMGNCTLFPHTGEEGSRRGELFTAMVMDPMEETDMALHLYRLGNGLDSSYTGTSDPEGVCSPHAYIHWYASLKGVCTVGMRTENQRNLQFVEQMWLSYAENRYFLSFILVLHEKYTMYHYLNEIAGKKNLSSMKGYQKRIMLFNTQFRFEIISEETSYQTLYTRLREVKNVDRVFNDINDEVERINSFHESVSDVNNTNAMTIIGVLCVISALKDCFELITADMNTETVLTLLQTLPPVSKVLLYGFILFLGLALGMLVPKTIFSAMGKWIRKQYAQGFLRWKK